MGQSPQTPLGQRLVERGLITEAQLTAALTNPVRRRLGRQLLLDELLDSKQLVQALAEQLDEPWAPLNPFQLERHLLDGFPRRLALRYAVLPVAEEGETLVLASERLLSQVSVGAISRQLGRPVRWQLAPQGRVTLGLRYCYGGRNAGDEVSRMLAVLERHADDEALLEEVCKHQVLFGDLLQVRGLLPPSLFNQALIDFDPETQSLGQHLLQRGVISEEVLQQALREQAEEQHESYRIVEALA